MTKQKTDQRWRNGKGYRRCTHFWSAIQKYGWDNFKHEIIASGLTYEKACELERMLITGFKTNNNQNGYNLENGGDAVKALSLKTRAKMSESAKSSWTEERRYNASVTQRGKPKSQEARKNMSTSKKEFLATHRHPSSKAVICLDSGTRFESAKAAAEWAGVGLSALTRCCRGEGKKSGGYRWVYEELI
jgi:hypothetical protein